MRAPSEDLEVEESADALTQAEYECERAKRECLTTADCDADMREACESAFRACKEPAQAEREQVREMCKVQRKSCEAAATDEAVRHACHVAAHQCTLAVDPPEAVCHIDALECTWAARAAAPDPSTPPMMSAAEEACHEAERACREAKRLDRADLPKPPRCEPPPPPPCTADPAPVAPECAERERVREMCRSEREACDAAATDEAGRHACHIAEHRCKLPVEPPEAVCHIDAEECLWAAHGMAEMPPPPPPPPAPMMPREPNAAEQACHEAEHTCVQSLRIEPEDAPEPPHCPPRPPACTPPASP